MVAAGIGHIELIKLGFQKLQGEDKTVKTATAISEADTGGVTGSCYLRLHLEDAETGSWIEELKVLQDSTVLQREADLEEYILQFCGRADEMGVSKDSKGNSNDRLYQEGATA